jgi:hypothetical protein
VLTAYDASVVPVTAREADIGPVLSAFQGPLNELARLATAPLPAIDAAAVRVNCLHAVQVCPRLWLSSMHRLTDARVHAAS